MPSLSSDGTRQDLPLPDPPPPAGPPPDGPPHLRVRDLDVAYGRALTALRGVRLDVPAGGAVALLGANGAGKSTLLRSVSGTLRLHRGAITAGSVHYGPLRLNGQDPVAAVRAGVVQVPEGRRVFAGLTVDENLRAGGLGLGRRAPAVVRSARERVFGLFPRLAERRTQRAGLLSGGEQQMLAIGRALMAEPRLLLLDEPSLGLAPLMVERIAEVIREINAQGTSILLVEQNAAMALALAGHAYVLDVGEVRLAGPAAELRRTDAVRRLYLGEDTEPGPGAGAPARDTPGAGAPARDTPEAGAPARDTSARGDA
ncbi:ABC transporter ATP-binding protein [Streptomyces sp. NPDC008313]|uniref:ABC transporter ATP-binding protein n=1 Tax=Streptomyces sp. NPDC008313 TaxID=3364826 RepID=UPI0036E2578D